MRKIFDNLSKVTNLANQVFARYDTRKTGVIYYIYLYI